MSTLLVLKDINKHYVTPGGNIPVLKNVNLTVMAGETIAIVGPSGSGKSTLLNIIGALDVPSAGSIDFDGKALLQLNDKQQAALRNRRLGFIFQLHHLLPQYTVWENVLLPALAGGTVDESCNRARQLLERVGLNARIHHKPSQLSGGEQQRVAVVRALVNNPQLVLADEPTGSLDQKTADNLVQLLVELNAEQQTTLLMVTHSQHLAQRMQKILTLDNGDLKEASL